MTTTAASIGVCVATYGDPTWGDLAERHACASVEAQTVKPAELHVMHDVDGTLAQVRNEAASRATTDWLCFLDADDQLDEHYIAAMADGLMSGHLLNPAVERDDVIGLIPARESIWHGNWLVIGTLIPRALFVECGGFWDERGWEDWSLWIRAVELGAEVVNVPDAIYRVGRSSGRNTVTQPYALGRQIRETNKAWLRGRFNSTTALADAERADAHGLAREMA